MKQLTSSQVRQMFLDFFKEHGHMVMQSASLIPQDDPTLLWINSGVATMKKYFDGSVVPKNHRITSCLLYTSPSPRDPKTSRMPSSA